MNPGAHSFNFRWDTSYVTSDLGLRVEGLVFRA